MTVGVTVRTLQYYDKEGLLSPSSTSEGGRRLYTDKDVIKLYQLLSLKDLGFPLEDIKNRLISLDTPAEVADALTEQAAAIREKIRNLPQSLKEIEALKAEVLQMQSVDFKKYADIITNLQMNNEFYWMIKHLGENTLNHFRDRFDMDSAMTVIETFTRLSYEAEQLQKAGVPPESEKRQNFAREFWEMITDFTGGDMSILSNLMETASLEGPDEE